MAGPPAGVVVVMGVSGSGKSTVGTLLAEALQCPFHDADDFHPPENIAKMKRGEPLSDADRLPWLQNLHRVLKGHADRGEQAVLACSALKASYRGVLQGSIPQSAIAFVLLAPSRGELMARVSKRAAEGSHFMPPALLESQLSTLEALPTQMLATFSNEEGQPFPSPEDIVRRLMQQASTAGM
eukprot:jgi/Tetstr1/430655/TSEL_020448.t1